MNENNEENRRFTDLNGHMYHSLIYGDPSGTDEDHLKVHFSRIDPSEEDQDSHELLLVFPEGADSMVLTRQFMFEILRAGWNGEISGNTIDCDDLHDGSLFYSEPS